MRGANQLSVSTGKRDRGWIAREVITTLDDFAVRAGRRS
ncbi:hypothetical protein JOF29_004733 [Kribbella aluminosa]|uniref:Uncharacterized protein n=1 Tax=Kribbella aluminosa TaxID=416017 RepID=A0ABS4UPQ4_9ACTN|nr:hypothetical protein [Kribbella aluminosa]